MELCDSLGAWQGAASTHATDRKKTNRTSFFFQIPDDKSPPFASDSISVSAWLHSPFSKLALTHSIHDMKVQMEDQRLQCESKYTSVLITVILIIHRFNRSLVSMLHSTFYSG
jgi:hypothetical protein